MMEMSGKDVMIAVPTKSKSLGHSGDPVRCSAALRDLHMPDVAMPVSITQAQVSVTSGSVTSARWVDVENTDPYP